MGERAGVFWIYSTPHPPTQISSQHQGCCRKHNPKSRPVAPCPWGQTLALHVISCSANCTPPLSYHRGYSSAAGSRRYKSRGFTENERIQLGFKLESAEQTGFPLTVRGNFPKCPVRDSSRCKVGYCSPNKNRFNSLMEKAQQQKSSCQVDLIGTVNRKFTPTLRDEKETALTESFALQWGQHPDGKRQRAVTPKACWGAAPPASVALTRPPAPRTAVFHEQLLKLRDSGKSLLLIFNLCCIL